MRNRRPVRCHFCALAALALAAGCQAFHQYRPVVIETRDAETGKPISGASVHLSYPVTNPDVAPWDDSGTTAADGTLQLRAAPYGDVGVRVDAAAAGYMAQQKNLSVEAVQALEPAPLFGNAGPRPVSLVVEMLAEPEPAVELVVPTGYRGVVRAEVEVRDDLPCPPGQRLFTYPVSSKGVVKVTGPALLRRVVAADFRLRYADGTPLTRQAPDGQVQFWWVQAESRYQYFFVGTRLEFDNFRRGMPNEPAR